jgi:hypothetical protein
MSGKTLAGPKFNFAEWHEDMCPLRLGGFDDGLFSEV